MGLFKWLKDRLWLLKLPSAYSSVGSDHLCIAFQKTRVYVDTVPGCIRDIVMEYTPCIPDITGSVNDSLGCETLNDAIFNAELVGLCLVEQVEPDNFLFVFGKTVQALKYALVDSGFLNVPLEPFCHFGHDCNTQMCRGYNKNKPYRRAIILCKVKNADIFQHPFWAEKKKGGGPAQRYEITWGELQEIKDILGG